MATKIESTEITQPKKVFVKSEEVLDEMETNGQLEPFTDYYTDDEESDEFKAINFAESERLKTLNLFKSDIVQGAWIFSDGHFMALNNYVCNGSHIPCKPNTTYTLSFQHSSSYNMSIAGFCFYDENVTFISSSDLGLTTDYITEYTFTTPANCYYMCINFWDADQTSISVSYIYNIMLNEGSTVLEYQPYSGDVIHKTDLSLLNSDARLGKNLFDFDSFIVPTVFQNPSNGTATVDFTNRSITMTASSNDQYLTIVNGVQLKPNTLYSFGFEVSPTNANIEIYIYTPEYEWVGTSKNHYTFITGASGLVNHFRIDNNTAGATTTFSKIMLNEGDVLLPYEEFKGRVLCEKDDMRYIGVPTETILDISLSSSDFVWTAPQNGYIVVGCQGAADGGLGYFRIWNVGQTIDPTVDVNVLYAINASAVYSYHTANNILSATCVVKKGDKVRMIYGNVQNPSARFVYGGAVL